MLLGETREGRILEPSARVRVVRVVPTVWWSGPLGDVVIGIARLASAQVPCPGSRLSSTCGGGGAAAASSDTT